MFYRLNLLFLLLIYFPFIGYSEEFKKNVSKNNELIEVYFAQISFKDALNILANMVNKQPIFSNEIHQNNQLVELKIQNQTWRQGIQNFLDAHQFQMQESEDKIYFHKKIKILPAISPPINQTLTINKNATQIDEKLTFKYYKIQHRNAQKLYDILVSQGGKSKLLSARGDLLVDNTSNQIIIVDTKSKVDIIHKILKTLDKKAHKIRVSAIISIVKNTSVSKLGVSWFANKNIGSINFTGLTTSNSLTGGVNTQSVINDFSVGDADTFLSFGDNGQDQFVKIQLSALASDSEAEILSEPQILLLDNIEGVISSGQEIPYSTVDDQGNTTVNFKSVLLELKVIAKVLPNDIILLNMSLKQDSVGAFYNNIPSIDTNYFNTQTRIKNDQNIVVGGILSKKNFNQLKKVPGLGDIPYLGNLFKYQEEIKESWTLLIFLFPTIID